MNREAIGLNDSTMNMMMKMSEGNPGAITVCTEILKADPIGGFMALLSLDDMNMRGSQIWVGFKDHCKQDLGAFLAAITERDPEMVTTVNAACPESTPAVTGGASSNR